MDDSPFFFGGGVSNKVLDVCIGNEGNKNIQESINVSIYRESPPHKKYFIDW